VGAPPATGDASAVLPPQVQSYLDLFADAADAKLLFASPATSQQSVAQSRPDSHGGCTPPCSRCTPHTPATLVLALQRPQLRDLCHPLVHLHCQRRWLPSRFRARSTPSSGDDLCTNNDDYVQTTMCMVRAACAARELEDRGDVAGDHVELAIHPHGCESDSTGNGRQPGLSLHPNISASNAAA
jgi:hypothetical protein